MPSYEEDLSEFERRNAQVLGISTDQVFSNEAWAKSMGALSYPLLSDNWPYGFVATQYGVMRGSGTVERAIFVVDKSGVIRYIDIHDIAEQPPTDKIMEALDKLRGGWRNRWRCPGTAYRSRRSRSGSRTPASASSRRPASARRTTGRS